MPDERKAISFSLFGRGLKYVQGAVENAWLAPRIYPGWDCVFHVERAHPVIPELIELGAIVIEHDPEPGLAGTFWRFETIAPPYDVVVCRDADSRIHERDKACVDEWLAGDMALHVMRNVSTSRIRSRPIPAGLFGIRVNAFDFASELTSWEKRSGHAMDERFLGRALWRRFEGNRLLHRLVNAKGDEVPFPQTRDQSWRVGCRCDPRAAGMPVFRIGAQPCRSSYCIPRVDGIGAMNGATTAHRNAAETILRRGAFPALLVEADAAWMRRPRRADIDVDADWLWVGLSRHVLCGDRQGRKRNRKRTVVNGVFEADDMLANHAVVLRTPEAAHRIIAAAHRALAESIPIDVAIIELSRLNGWSRPALANPWLFQRGKWRAATRFRIRPADQS